MRYFISGILAAVLFICSCTAAGFAETKTVPVYMNVAASTVDFEITPKINMTVKMPGTPELTIDPLIVTNNGSMGVVKLDSVAVSSVGGWNLVADSTDFINMFANQQNFSLVGENTHDFGKSEVMEIGKSAASSESIIVNFSGKTGAVTEEIQNLQVAAVVATVSLA